MNPMLRPSTNRPFRVPICGNKWSINGINQLAEMQSYLDVLVSLFRGESTAVAQEVDEANRNATINVQDELFEKAVQIQP